MAGEKTTRGCILAVLVGLSILVSVAALVGVGVGTSGVSEWAWRSAETAASPYPDLALPTGQNALDMVQAPLLVVKPKGIHLHDYDVTIADWGSGERVASTPLATAKPKLVKPIRQKLQARRKAWKESNPGETFPGVILIAADERLSVQQVLAVSYSAAWAGYPNLSYVVRGPTGFQRLAVQAMIPDFGGWTPPTEQHLLILLEGNTATLRWRQPNGALGSPARVRLNDVGPHAQHLHDAEGKHRHAADEKWDWAYMWAQNASMAQLAATIDGVYAPSRNYRVRGTRALRQISSSVRPVSFDTIRTMLRAA